MVYKFFVDETETIRQSSRFKGLSDKPKTAWIFRPPVVDKIISSRNYLPVFNLFSQKILRRSFRFLRNSTRNKTAKINRRCLQL